MAAEGRAGSRCRDGAIDGATSLEIVDRFSGGDCSGGDCSGGDCSARGLWVNANGPRPSRSLRVPAKSRLVTRSISVEAGLIERGCVGAGRVGIDALARRVRGADRRWIGGSGRAASALWRTGCAAAPDGRGAVLARRKRATSNSRGGRNALTARLGNGMSMRGSGRLSCPNTQAQTRVVQVRFHDAAHG